MAEQQQQNNKIQVSNMDRIKAMSKNVSVISSFAQVLGSKREAQGFIASVMIAVGSSKDLMECQPASIWSCALRSAALRLSVDPALGQAHLVPFNDKKKGLIATFIPGYRGIETLALRTSKYRFIHTSEIYEGQAIEEDQLTGKIKIVGQRTGNTVIGYCNYFEYFDGFSHAVYMTVEQIHAFGKRYAKSYDNPYGKWQTDFPSMAKKTVLKQNLTHNGSLSTQDAAILEADEADKLELDGEMIDTTFEDVHISDEEIAEQKAKAILDEAGKAKVLAELGFEKQSGG